MSVHGKLKKLFRRTSSKDGKDVIQDTQKKSTLALGGATCSSEEIVTVHPDTDDPDKAWHEMRLSETIRPLSISDSSDLEPVSDKRLRCVCISDTHTKFETRENYQVPHGDVLIHCGDFTTGGMISQVRSFNKFLGTLPHGHKVVIAGNHDELFDKRMVSSQFMKRLKETYGCTKTSSLLTNAIYIEDEMIQIAGIKIYGSPWVAEYASDGFTLQRGAELLEKWNRIPSSVDILLTHMPPLGAGDLARRGDHVGCVELINTVQKRVKPFFHVFGHIHEGYGMFTDGRTTFINASMCNRKYQPTNDPVVFDIDIPKGFKKDDSVVRISSL